MYNLNNMDLFFLVFQVARCLGLETVDYEVILYTEVEDRMSQVCTGLLKVYTRTIYNQTCEKILPIKVYEERRPSKMSQWLSLMWQSV